uniref:ATP synthase F0 subunit 8 n=1 Tax=Lasmigona complanata TaxID=85050 RepID=UPI00226CC6B1|nr:ATP synthase F0 subunit 8 [Lasmigona complanata]UZC55590.1 ATP synthase subunit 8 [Lasmigona complanata]
MPQLSPMSWVMVISVFLVCLVFFAVLMWWLVDGKYDVKRVSSKNNFMLGKDQMKGSSSEDWKKNSMKWGFGKSK